MACPSSMASERKPPELTPSTTFDNISTARVRRDEVCLVHQRDVRPVDA